VAVDDDKEPCGTVLEAAKVKGFMTGLIVTSRITHVRQLVNKGWLFNADTLRSRLPRHPM